MRLTIAFLAALCAGMFAWVPVVAARNADQERDEVRQMSQKVLEKLYAVGPSARKAIDRSACYAVFSNFGTKILMGGGGAGTGLAFNRKTMAEMMGIEPTSVA